MWKEDNEVYIVVVPNFIFEIAIQKHQTAEQLVFMIELSCVGIKQEDQYSATLVVWKDVFAAFRQNRKFYLVILALRPICSTLTGYK